jgi:hypothetical protein
MAQQEEGKPRPFFQNPVVQGIDVPGYQGKAVMIGAVPPEPPGAGIVYL